MDMVIPEAKREPETEMAHTRPTLLDAIHKREERCLRLFLRYGLLLSMICIGVMMVLLFLLDR